MASTKIAFAAGLIFLSRTAYPQGIAPAASCETAYANNLANITTSDRVAALNSEAYSKYCRADGSINKTSFTGNLKLIIDSIPATQAITYGSDDEKMTQFCHVGYSNESMYSKDSEFTRTVVVEAEQNYNQCKALESAGLILVHDYTAPRLLTFIGHDKDEHIGSPSSTAPAGSLQSIAYNEKRIKCNSPTFQKPSVFGSRTPLTGSMSPITIDRSFVISCERIPTSKDGSDYYPDVQVVLTVLAQGINLPYHVSLPADVNYGPSLASAAKGQIDQLTVSNANLKNDLSTAQKDNDNLKTELNGAHVVAATTIAHSDYNLPNQMITRIGCDDSPQAFADRWCPANTIHQNFPVSSQGGSTCGYGIFAISCLAK